MDNKQRFILLEPTAIHVCTLGPKGDGSDNLVETFRNAYIEQDYYHTTIRHKAVRPDAPALATYKTKEIVCQTRKEPTEDDTVILIPVQDNPST